MAELGKLTLKMIELYPWNCLVIYEFCLNKIVKNFNQYYHHCSKDYLLCLNLVKLNVNWANNFLGITILKVLICFLFLISVTMDMS